MKSLGSIFVQNAHFRIYNPTFQQAHKRKPVDFIRSRKLGFVTIMLFLLNLVRKSLQVEVDEFYDAYDAPQSDRATMDAFIKARNKVMPSAFIDIFESSAAACLDSDELPTFKGYRVFAIDGSQLLFPANEDILNHLEPSQNDPKQAVARISALCEVHTGIIVAASIDSTKVDERSMAINHLDVFFKGMQEHDVVLFDRGYPSKKLFALLSDNSAFFLMRVQRAFSPIIDAASLGESIFKFEYKCHSYSIRLCKFLLPTGEIEILASNLPQTDFTTDDLYQLYALRWGVETLYDTLKNRLQLERFTCRKWDYILQDFYATLFVSNVVAAFAEASNELIVQRECEQAKIPKHKHVVSKNVLIGKMKNHLFRAIAANNPPTRSYYLNKISKEASRCYDSFRPFRTSSRRKKKESHHKKFLPRSRAL